MTLEQSEFQRLVELMVSLIERYKGNPTVLGAILSEFQDLYKKVPIYPGIITTCLPKAIQDVGVDKLKEGDEVVLTLKEGLMISGKVAGVDPKEIGLVEHKQLTISPVAEKVSVQKESVKEAKLIVRDILEKEWPSLDFEEE